MDGDRTSLYTDRWSWLLLRNSDAGRGADVTTDGASSVSVAVADVIVAGISTTDDDGRSASAGLEVLITGTSNGVVIIIVVVVAIEPFVLLPLPVVDVVVDRFGAFSLMYSSTMGASFLIETRFSDFTLPKCFRIESRRGIIGEAACDGQALIEM